MTLRLAFLGTPDFAAASLAEIAAAGHDIVRVYTQPPRPKGRGHEERKTPVHELAETLGLPVETPKSFKDPDVLADFAALDLDVAVVVAYGQILPQAALDAPRFGCLNLHGSLLPRWRGAAPIQRAIMAGDDVTGVQVMRMEAGLDTGPILLSESVSIGAGDTAGSLHDKLAIVAAQLCPRALAALSRGGLTETPQEEDRVTYAHKITSDEARIDWTRPAAEVDRHIRGLSPFPGAWFELDGVRVKGLLSRVATGGGALPGKIVQKDEQFIVACGEGSVELLTLQRAGKRAQSAKDFLLGFAADAERVT